MNGVKNILRSEFNHLCTQYGPRMFNKSIQEVQSIRPAVIAIGLARYLNVSRNSKLNNGGYNLWNDGNTPGHPTIAHPATDDPDKASRPDYEAIFRYVALWTFVERRGSP
jgi:hypothetical protein